MTVRSGIKEWIEVKTANAGSKRTWGELTLRVVKGRIQVVNVLDIERYLKGILEPELGSLKLRREVLKAQLVTARSYVLSMRGERHAGEGYEFCDSPHCQVFGGVTERIPRFDQMAAAVKGEYLAYKGRPIAAFYHHSCGGATSAVQDVWPVPARPYLRAVQEGPGSFCRLAPSSHWRFSAKRKTLAACFRRAVWLQGRATLADLDVARRDASGRAQQVSVQSNKPLWVPIGKFRNVVNQHFGKEVLKSAVFTVTRQGDTFVFEGRGWGHGVGFCQEGAIHMARQGKTYKQILRHYFPNTTLARQPKE